MDLSRRHALALSVVGVLSLLGGGALAGCSRAADAEGEPSADPEQEPASPTQPAELKVFSTFLFDTYIEIKAACDQALLDRLNERLIFFENTFSRTREGSDIFTLNMAGGAPVEVHEETAALISQSLVFSELSGGLFDISIGAVSSLWDFKEGILPDATVLAEAVTHVDYRGIEVNGTTITLADPAARLDLGGIAKGYAADEMVRLLREGGCESALINLGGNVYALGLKPDGTPWSVGVQDPQQPRGTLKAVTAAHDLSVVTSGPYERGFEQDGVFYHHILDPRTGYPVQTDLASATIFSDLSCEGDALTTCCFLMGQTAALKLVRARPGVDALLVDLNGEVLMTDDTIAELR
ncbi:MAG: FAD:protein FMN transferase [Coriobacteriales bacterium]|nr:FAD:protein FMN transferase [Coriobacteriales bacterium]